MQARRLRYGAVADLPPQSQVARLMDGYMTTQLLYIAAKLGIADVLAGVPAPPPRSRRRWALIPHRWGVHCGASWSRTSSPRRAATSR
jgi:hypothetical protein